MRHKDTVFQTDSDKIECKVTSCIKNIYFEFEKLLQVVVKVLSQNFQEKSLKNCSGVSLLLLARIHKITCK